KSTHLVLEPIRAISEIHPALAVAKLDRKRAQVVGPLVERATGGEIEARVVPVAGEDSVADRAAVKREAHVRAAVVDRLHVVSVRKEPERVPVQRDDERPEPPDVVER